MSRSIILAGLAFAYALSAWSIWLLAEPSSPHAPRCTYHCDWQRERVFSRCGVTLSGDWACFDPLLSHTRKV